jgi:hypothetical protein
MGEARRGDKAATRISFGFFPTPLPLPYPTAPLLFFLLVSFSLYLTSTAPLSISLLHTLAASAKGNLGGFPFRETSHRRRHRRLSTPPAVRSGLPPVIWCGCSGPTRILISLVCFCSSPAGTPRGAARGPLPLAAGIPVAGATELVLARPAAWLPLNRADEQH